MIKNWHNGNYKQFINIFRLYIKAGMIIGSGYRIGDKIGSGAFGEVYKAYN